MDLLRLNGDNLALHTINLLFKTRYDGPVTVSTTWEALDAKRHRNKFGPTEERMLTVLKRDYGLTDGDGATYKCHNRR